MGNLKIMVLVIILCGAFLMAGAFGSIIYSHFKPKAPVAQGFSPAPEIPEAAAIPKVVIVPQKIHVYQKEEAVKKLALPEPIKSAPTLQISSSAIVEPNEGKTEVVGVINTTTGDTDMYVKPLSPPFFEFVNEKEVGIWAGMSSEGRDFMLDARWTFMRVWKLRFAVKGEIEYLPDASRDPARARALVGTYARFQ